MWSVAQPVSEAGLRARLEHWAGYDMADERRPLVVFDDHLAEDRLLFRYALERRGVAERSWATLPPLPPSAVAAVEELRGVIDLEDRPIAEAHAGWTTRWTDRGLVALPATVVHFSGIEQPYLVLTTEDLPPIVHLRHSAGIPVSYRHPGAYLHADGRTLDVMFRGYPAGADYRVHQVLESDTAVTFSVVGTAAPGVEVIESSGEERWTTITLGRPLGNRFVISNEEHPLIVVDARRVRGVSSR